MIRAAIIGLGRWGRSLVNSVHGKSDAIQFTRAYTRTRASAEDVLPREATFRSPPATSDILADPDIDAVVLATPHSQHETQVRQAAAAGKHIHVEKPITLDYAERAVGRRRRAATPASCWRSASAVASIPRSSKSASVSPTAGSAMCCPWWRSTPPRPASSSRRTTGAPRRRKRPAARSPRSGVHSLDHMIEFAGRVRDVRCVTARVFPGPSDDTTTVMLRFESGATGLLFCSVATATNFCFTLYGSKGLAEISKPTLQSFRFVPTSDTPPTGQVTAPPDQTAEHPDLRHAARRDDRVRPRHPRPHALPGAGRRRAARHGGVRRDRAIGENQHDRNGRVMQTRTLGSSGLVVSAVGLGGNNFGGRIDLAASRAVVHKALDLGITLIDTADSYGNRGGSEEALGEILGSRRNDIVLATKFGLQMDDAGRLRGASRGYIMRAVEASLTRLRTDRIDLYQLHRPDAKTPIEETLRALDDLVRQGKVRFIGCSNLPAKDVIAAQATARAHGLTPFVSCQDEYSLLEREIERELLPVITARGLGLLPYFPLASGLLTGKYVRGTPLPPGTRLARNAAHAADYLTDRNWRVVEALGDFARRKGHSLIELAFGWLLSHPEVSSVIAGATSAEQIEANVAAAGWRLSADELAEVDRLTREAG